MNSLTKLLATGVVAAAAMSFSGSAMAVTIFEDNFNRGNTDFPGSPWSQLEAQNNDVAINNGRLRIRDNLSGLPDAAAAAGTFSTVGYTNIQLSLDWNDFNANENNDVLNISWAIGSPNLTDEGDWTILDTVNNNGSGIYSLLGAEGLGAISIMLWTNVTDNGNGNSEGFHIDNFKLTGDLLATIPVPAALPLALTGLGFLGFTGWRRSHKTV